MWCDTTIQFYLHNSRSIERKIFRNRSPQVHLRKIVNRASCRLWWCRQVSLLLVEWEADRVVGQLTVLEANVLERGLKGTHHERS